MEAQVEQAAPPSDSAPVGDLELIMQDLAGEANASPASEDEPAEQTPADASEGAETGGLPEGDFDLQATLDAAIAEMIPAEAPAPSTEPAGVAATNGSGPDESTPVASSVELLDIDSFESDEAREVAAKANQMALANHALEQRLTAMEGFVQRIEHAEVQAIAQQVVDASVQAAQSIREEYGVNVDPRYLLQLMQQDVEFVRSANRMAPNVVLDVFGRRHFKDLMTAARRKDVVSAVPKAPPATVGGGGRGGNPSDGKPLSDRDLIERDLKKFG